LTHAGKEILGCSIHSGAMLEELLTTVGGPFTTTAANGDTIQTVDGAGTVGPATGIAHLYPQQTTVTLRLDQADQSSHGVCWAAPPT
jgi:hypothetical protein